MRLIDADKLMKELTEYRYDTATPETRRAAHATQALYQEIIEKQPTAYDVDKVLERLEKAKYEDELYPCNLAVEIEEAKSIVKSGGIE